MKTNAQIRAAQITKATAFIKRAFKNEEVKPQELDVADKGTHIEVYAIGNKKFGGIPSDYEIAFNIKKGAISDLSYMSPSVNLELMVTQNINVGKRNQVAAFAKSLESTAASLQAEAENIMDTIEAVTKFNDFVWNAMVKLEEAAADGEFEFAPANEQAPEKKVPHKQAVANSKAKAAKKPAKKTELVAVSKRGRVAKVRVPVAKPASKAKTAVAKKAAKPAKKAAKKVDAKPVKKNKAVEKVLKATLKKATKKAEAKPAKKVSKVAAKTAAAKKAVAKKTVK